MSDKRLIDANVAIKIADKCYEEWNLAMAAAEGNRQINMVYKKQELFKAVKKVVENCDTIDPETLRPTAHIVHGTVPETEDGVFCSRCGGFIGMETSYIAEHAAFCWHCGAKMEE